MHRGLLVVLTSVGALFAASPGLARAQPAPAERGCPCPMMDMMMNALVTVTDTPTGAAIFFRASDPAQIEALRAQVRWHAQHLEQGTCPRMGGPSPPPARGPHR